MKRSLSCLLLLFAITALTAQKPLPDSIMKEFARLTCECATLMKIDEGSVKDGITNLGTCINSTIGVYEQQGWIKKEWLNDSAWATNFDNELQRQLEKSCPAFKTLAAKSNQQTNVPEPLDVTPEKYFLAAASMTIKGLESNPQATSGTMRRWSAKKMDDAKIQIVFDIRMVFNNVADASAYFQAKLDELSEGGELTANTLKTEGADESKVYGANPKIMGAFGDLDMAQYNFVFRVKNVVAKVFVSTSKKATYPEVVIFPREAIQRIKAARL